jgi:hypothetical protein
MFTRWDRRPDSMPLREWRECRTRVARATAIGDYCPQKIEQSPLMLK